MITRGAPHLWKSPYDMLRYGTSMQSNGLPLWCPDTQHWHWSNCKWSEDSDSNVLFWISLWATWCFIKNRITRVMPAFFHAHVLRQRSAGAASKSKEHMLWQSVLYTTLLHKVWSRIHLMSSLSFPTTPRVQWEPKFGTRGKKRARGISRKASHGSLATSGSCMTTLSTVQCFLKGQHGKRTTASGNVELLYSNFAAFQFPVGIVLTTCS